MDIKNILNGNNAAIHGGTLLNGFVRAIQKTVSEAYQANRRYIPAKTRTAVLYQTDPWVVDGWLFYESA